jgi:uncharacterized protein YodC (DUF2158 family)
MNNLREQISNGDLVRLNSGSPELKVVNVSGEYCEVEWSDQKSILPICCFSPLNSN